MAREAVSLGDGRHIASRAALVDGQAAPWSIILKMMAGRLELQPGAIDHPLYWEREALVYQSGLLEDLPGGVIAPLPGGYGRIESLWLWLEQVRANATARAGRWSSMPARRAAWAASTAPTWPAARSRLPVAVRPDHARHARSFRRLARDYQ